MYALYLCRDQFWGFNYQKERVYIYEKFYMKYTFACDEFDHPEVTLSGLRDVKIHLWLNQPPLLAHEIWQHSLHPFPEDTSAKNWYKGQIAFYYFYFAALGFVKLVCCHILKKFRVYLLLNVALRRMRWCCCSWAKCGNEMLDVGCHSLNHLVLIFCSIQVHCNKRCKQSCYHTVVAWISVMSGRCHTWQMFMLQHQTHVPPFLTVLTIILPSHGCTVCATTNITFVAVMVWLLLNLFLQYQGHQHGLNSQCFVFEGISFFLLQPLDS